MAFVGMIKFQTSEIESLVIEINSQVLNFLFTITAVMNQPQRAVNVILLLDKKYSKLQVTYPWASPDKKIPLWILLILFNLNCIFQYPITAVMWGWITKQQQRPNAVVYTFLSLSFLCAAIGGLWQWWQNRQFEKSNLMTQL